MLEHACDYPFLCYNWDKFVQPIELPSIFKSFDKNNEPIFLSTVLMNNDWKVFNNKWIYKPDDNLLTSVQNKISSILIDESLTINKLYNWKYPANGIHIFDFETTYFSQFIHRY